METYGELEWQLHAFLTSLIDGGEQSASRPSSFTPAVRAPRTYWIGGWVGPIPGLDAVAKRILCSFREWQSIQPLALSLYWLNYPGFWYPKIILILSLPLCLGLPRGFFLFLSGFPSNLCISHLFDAYYDGRLKRAGTHLILRVGICAGAVTVSFSKYLPCQTIHLLERSTPFSKTCCWPFAANFRRILEQVVLTSWSLRAQSSLFIVTLHRLHRFDGCVVGFLIHFFPSRTKNSIAQHSTKEIS
jgi:hypothetical protein